MKSERHNFTVPQQRAIKDRSKGICEAGKFETHAFYGMAPGDVCKRRAEEIDHITADALKRTRIQSIDEGLHVCLVHHKIKTAEDKKKIAKSKRLDDDRHGIRKPTRPIRSRGFGAWESNTKQIYEEFSNE